ncbi:hypothetical protein UY286_10735 [Paenibacillus polymyxa]|uniref:hypothetical protein n=1 Tax=Paenibacillus polymyxa TaxID=1406 RepID=UPI002AB3675F|nr:hypothetical protein [Paenibacillus polymyxa]MDY7991476.1 hypothetical protein [Paenibacillus polymyxa]MDY8117917.1 hypothetical protein [Paenibacillus polymyxa]
MKQNWFKRFTIPIILLILLVYVYGANIGKITEVIAVEGKENVGEITDGMEIGQSFYSNLNNLSGFSIKLATYARINQGDVIIGIRKYGENSDIYSTTVKAESLPDNTFYDVRFPPIKFSKDKEYYIFVKSSGGIPGKSITAYKSTKDAYAEGYLLINGVEKQGDLAFKVYFNKTLF